MTEEDFNALAENYEYLKTIVAVLVWHKGGTVRIDNRDLKLNYRIEVEPYADEFYSHENEEPVKRDTGLLIKVYQDELDSELE